MKLISMTDFVLEQTELYKLDKISVFDFALRVKKYAQFLKQPLILGVFVPCDEEGNVLKECTYLYDVYKNLSNDEKRDYKSRCEKYQQAKEKVLFEGLIKMTFTSISGDKVVQYSKDNNFNLEPILEIREDKIKFLFKTIEDLVILNLTLTETAKKQIGL
ncbi:hypothetical protein [Empedobacter falsenii]